MNTWLDSLVQNGTQCWGCGFFDRLFQVISNAAAAAYAKLAFIAIVILLVLAAFHILRNVMNNSGVFTMFKTGEHNAQPDVGLQKTLKPLLINGTIIIALLMVGLWLPRFISIVTFEPISEITLVYSQAAINTNPDMVQSRVSYTPLPMDEEGGFYRPQLRDTIINIMKTTITQFQNMIMLGLAIIDKSFSLSAILGGIGNIILHIMLFFIGWGIIKGIFDIFIKFCCYFIDVILAMTYFAFFFPFMLVLLVFRNVETVGWIKNLGQKMTPDFFKGVITAIVSMAVAVITYSVIIILIASFFAKTGTPPAELERMIMDGSLYSGALSEDNLATITLTGFIVLMYIINFLAAQVPVITGEILKAFNVSEEHKVGEDLGGQVLQFGKKGLELGKQLVGITKGK
ncbi:MAG: hypothetical protein LBO08_01055 [Rickettsiales bacterium]|jgi:hypothetical protein|nr:hypothetical protein [Rickettsiales bacterium]